MSDESKLIASLPMYDFPQLETAHDILWQHVRRKVDEAGLGPAPAHLSRGLELHKAWLAPNLILGQTCGYPLMTALNGQVQVVCTPRYKAAGCTGSYHRSFIVARKDDPAQSVAALKGRTAAVNSVDSNSGFNAFRAIIAPIANGADFFARVIFTTSHAISIDTILNKSADVAAIDCVTFALMQRAVPEKINQLKIVCESEPFPCLPYITAKSSPKHLVSLLQTILSDVDKFPELDDARSALLLDGFEVLPENAYDSILALEQFAHDRNYPNLA